MRNDLTPDQMPILPRSGDETRRAQITIAAYALRTTGSPDRGRDLTAELIDMLGLNGRPMRTARHKKTSGRTK